MLSVAQQLNDLTCIMVLMRESALTLQQLFDKAETPVELQTYLITDLQLKKVSDLVSYVAKSTFEEEWKEIVVGAFPVRAARAASDAVMASGDVPGRETVVADPGFSVAQQRLLVSRMRTTHRCALTVEEDAAEDKAAAKKDQYEADMEKPLDGETRTKYKDQWSHRHAWEPVPSMKGAPKLRNRVVREWQTLSMTNHTVEKAISSLQAKRPIEPERLPVGPAGSDAALIYERERPQTRTVNTVLEYVAALRLLVGVYAYCGTDLVPSHAFPGTQVEFFSWESALGYADNALHKVLEVAIAEHFKLRWLRLRDERTRAKMAHHINSGIPGGEALALAWSEHQHLWDMEDKVTLVETREETRDQPPRRQRSRSAQRNSSSNGQGKGNKNGNKNKGNHLDNIRTAQYTGDRRRICGAHNSKKGCRDPCPRGEMHVCNIYKPNGKVCEARDHGAWRCPIARG